MSNFDAYIHRVIIFFVKMGVPKRIIEKLTAYYKLTSLDDLNSTQYFVSPIRLQEKHQHLLPQFKAVRNGFSNLPVSYTIQMKKLKLKSYQGLKQLICRNNYSVNQFMSEQKTAYIFQQSQVLNEQHKQKIKSFNQCLPQEIALQIDNYCTMSLDGSIEIIQKSLKKWLFTFIKCAAVSINKLNKYGIYQNNITFKNFIKLEGKFKFAGLERALYIPRNQLESTKIHLSNLPQQRIGPSQKQLEKSTRDILDYFLRFDYIRGKEESEWFDNDSNDGQESILENSFQECPQISDIPKYIFGEDNQQLVADFIKIKQNPKFEIRENKIEKCIKILQDNYKNIHLQQLQKLMKKLLKDQFWAKANHTYKINKLQKDYILYLVQNFLQEKNTLDNFINLLNHLQQSKQNQQSREAIVSHKQQQQPKQKLSKPKQKVFSQSSAISVLQIEYFSQFIKKAHLSDIRQVYQFKKMIIQPIVKQTSTYIYSSAIQKLIDSLEYRTKSNEKIKQYFPDLPQFIQSLRQLINLDKGKQLPIQELKIQGDNQFQQFLDYQKCKKINPNSYSKSNMLMPEQIWKSKHFIHDQQLFFEHQIQYNKEKAYPKKEQNRIYFQQNLDADEMMKIDCLGCTTFMYEGFNINVNGITKTDAICFPSIHKISQEQHEIKRSIGALINSGGGVILFACSREYLSIIAKGQTIKESDQQPISQRISEYLKCFHPMLNFYSNAQLRFVPIVKSPYNNKIQVTDEKQQKKQRQYIQGRYVTVLRIWPSQISQIVFYSCNKEMLLYKRDKGQTIQIKGPLMLKYIKQKFNKNYIPEEEKNIIGAPYHCFEDHVCEKPQRGKLFQKRQKLEIYKEKDPSTAVKAYTQELKYNYASVVFLFQNLYQNVKRHLIDNNIRNFEFLELQKYQHVILLLHNQKPQSLKNLIEKQYLMAQGKNTLLMFNITNSLKFKRNINQIKFKQILIFLRDKKSTEFLKLYEYKSDYYIVTGSKVSFYYVFCYLKRNIDQKIKLVNLDITKIPGAKLISNSQTISL